MTLKFTIFGAPITKKNSSQILVNRKTGRPFVSPSSAYKRYEGDCIKQIPPSCRLALDKPCNVCCVFYMPTRRRCDITNLNSSLHDILVKGGVLADDNRDVVAASDGSRVYWDKANPRVEVTITPIGDADYTQWARVK